MLTLGGLHALWLGGCWALPSLRLSVCVICKKWLENVSFIFYTQFSKPSKVVLRFLFGKCHYLYFVLIPNCISKGQPGLKNYIFSSGSLATQECPPNNLSSCSFYYNYPTTLVQFRPDQKMPENKVALKLKKQCHLVF